MPKPTTLVVFIVSTAFALPVAAQDASRPDADPDAAEPVRVVADDASEPEEVIVVGEPDDPFKPHNFEYMQSTYDARGKGSCLYRRGDYAESFPYLLAAAKRGFKFAQARVSFLYQQGLGTERDAQASIGWLAAAATGTTHPEIRNRFREVWRQISDRQRAYYQGVVDDYPGQVRLPPAPRHLRFLPQGRQPHPVADLPVRRRSQLHGHQRDPRRPSAHIDAAQSLRHGLLAGPTATRSPRRTGEQAPPTEPIAAASPANNQP